MRMIFILFIVIFCLVLLGGSALIGIDHPGVSFANIMEDQENAIPSIDRNKSSNFQTATFAMG